MTNSRPVAVVTGASSGIGKETAKALAAQGWRVIAHGRDPARSAAAKAEIEAASTGGAVDMLLADLSLLAEAARLARDIGGLTDRIDVLVNNAGGVAADKWITAEGHEATFSGNHLGPFLLTDRLLPLLRRAAADAPTGTTRVVVTSSAAHEHAAGFDWADIEGVEDFQATPAYCRAKLANLLFARTLAKRLAGDGIVVNAMHPGIIDSNFVNHGDQGMQAYFKTQALATPAQGADTLIWLATADEAGQVSGGYFYDRRHVPSTAVGEDMAIGERLWAESERLVATTMRQLGEVA